MLARGCLKIDLTRKLAFSGSLCKRNKEPNRFGILIRKGESEIDMERMERKVRLLTNPNDRNQFKDFNDLAPTDSSKFLNNYLSSTIDTQRRTIPESAIPQKDVYGHYQTAANNNMDPYDLDEKMVSHIRYKSLRTKKGWENHHEASKDAINKYLEKFGQFGIFTSESKAKSKIGLQFEKAKEKIQETYRNKISKSEKIIDHTNEIEKVKINETHFNDWLIYYTAHKMMETENWSLGKMDESDALLKSVCLGPFFEQVKRECFNKTIKWNLENYYPNETKILGFSNLSLFGNGGDTYVVHLLMKSRQSLEVYDRMGNELIYDTEPRDCEEIVTMVFQSPDPLFYGWRIFDKRNVSTLADNFPNMRRTSSVRARKKQMDKLEKFMQEEAHRSYDIFTGTRKETEARRYDYYHRGWTYGGTQEGVGPTGKGSLEWKFSKLDFHEQRHLGLAKRKFEGRKREQEYFERHNLHYYYDSKSRSGRQLGRKRSRILYRRKLGEVRPANIGRNIWEVDQPQPK